MADDNPPPSLQEFRTLMHQAVAEELQQIKTEEQAEEKHLVHLLTRLDIVLVPGAVIIMLVLTWLKAGGLCEAAPLLLPAGNAGARVFLGKAI